MIFFFFKQKTAYEMRISDWSSDVCSSDLEAPQASSVDIVIDAKVREPRADLAQALELELEVDAIVHGAPGVRDITTKRDVGGPAAGVITQADIGIERLGVAQ